MRGASAAIVGRAGRRGANGLSSSAPARSSRNGFRAWALTIGANGLTAARGGANGLAGEPAPAAGSGPAEESGDAPLEPRASGSQLDRLAFEPRSASS